MRERILLAADEFGYSPNAIASILARRRSNIVGIVISELQNPFYPTLIEKLSRALQRAGQQSLLFNITSGNDIKQQLIALRQYNVDAIIIVSATALSAATLAWATESRNAILINRTVFDSSITSVCCDNADGARAIADHFYTLGHRRVAYVAGLPNTNTNFERRHGFVSRLAELGMTLTTAVDGGVYSYEAGHRAAIEIARTTSTDAIFFANDLLAVGGIDGLRETAGVPVPDEVSVAGFDDIAMAGWPHYALTTYRQPLDAIVDLTVSLLAEMARTGEREISINRIAGELVVRQSSGPRRSPVRRWRDPQGPVSEEASIE